jgi:hypothetical protein
MVDRRFNRARCDTDRTMATVVDRALEPAHVSVWISEPG